MTIKQVIHALGDWSIRLRQDTPRHVLDQLDYLGHLAVLPGRLDASMLGDAILTSARYVGVFRGRDAQDEYGLTGSGMAYWLGDEDDKGDIFESAVTLTAQTFVQSVTALLPAGGAVTAGTLHAQPGTYTGTHRWETPRKAITYVADLFDAEWRVNGDGTLDAGTVAQLYRTTPTTLLVRPGQDGRELARLAIGGTMRLATDVEDYSTRVVVLAEGQAGAIATGDADAVSVPYRDIHGNEAVITRLVSSAATSAPNADALAQLQLNRFTNARQNVTLDAAAYDITGDLAAGDYLAVYDPDNGFYDLNNEQYWRGRAINPIYLRCTELTWPVPAGWTVAFRRANGAWIDLSEYYEPEGGQTRITVGEFSRSLTAIGSQPVGTRPVADTSIPAAPAFTGFSVGTYQSETVTDGPVTSAAIRAQWSTPLNIDGSVVLDGDHYEIRYRVNAIIGYQVTHDEMELFSHDDFGTHDAMLSEPVQASPQWQIAIVGWGTNEFTIIELTPGVQYEIQIRGVDGAVPPNQGPWSASSFVTTLGDLIAPPIPSAPTVAGNRISIQVIHDLTTAAAGILPPDMNHLEVHVGGSASFTPDSTTYTGKLIATGSMALGGQTAVGSFGIEPVDQVHVKVVAVDRSGNRSGASESATVTAELIDDAHISDLTVSKVTAGTISATWVNAGRIVTALTGRRIELESDKLAIYGAGGGRLMSMSGPDRRISFFEPVDSSEGTMYSEPVIQLGQRADGGWGLSVGDLFGNTKVLMGQIVGTGGTGSDNYGLAAVDPDNGNLVYLENFIFGPDVAQVIAQEPRSSTSYGDLTTAGPQIVTTIGETGRALVLLNAMFDYTAVSGGSNGGFMSFEVAEFGSGDIQVSPSDLRSVKSVFSVTVTSGTISVITGGRFGAAVFLTGMTPGVKVFTAKYKVLGGTCNFADRVMAVFPY